MSVEALTWAWRQRVGSSTRKSILVALADHADNEGVCWPGHVGVSERVEVSRRTVLRQIEQLEKDGFLTVENRRRPDGTRTTNRYRLHVTQSHVDKVTTATQPSDTDDQNHVTPVSLQEPSVEPSKEPSEKAPAKRTRKKTKPDPESLPDDYPEQMVATIPPVLAALTRVADAMGAPKPYRFAVARAIQDYQDRDHVREAGSFEHYWIFGNGKGKRRRDVVMTFRRWLGNADASLAPSEGSAEPGKYAKYDRNTERIAV